MHFISYIKDACNIALHFVCGGVVICLLILGVWSILLESKITARTPTHLVTYIFKKMCLYAWELEFIVDLRFIKLLKILKIKNGSKTEKMFYRIFVCIFFPILILAQIEVQSRIKKDKTRKELWLSTHFDPIFGQPRNVDRFSGISENYEFPGVWLFKKIFSLNNREIDIAVHAPETGCFWQQGSLYEKLDQNLSDLYPEIANQILISGEADSLEKAKAIFDISSIDRIELEGRSPVSWKIYFDHPTQQDVFGIVIGEDWKVIGVKFDM